jgi:hypothetical protein
MPKIYNHERNICWQLDLVFNEYIDIVKGRPDSECWIPFDFLLEVEDSKYKFQEEGTCLTVWEAKKIINSFQDIIDIMRSNTKRDIFEARFKTFEHTSYEVFFDIKVSDADVDLLEIELRINMGYLTHSGYNTVFRFTVTLDEFEELTDGLKTEFYTILKTVEGRNDNF